MVTEAVLQMSLSEMEQVLNGCALIANSDDPYELQISPLLTSRFAGKARPVLSKKVEAGAISVGSVLKEAVARVSSIIAS